MWHVAHLRKLIFPTLCSLALLLSCIQGHTSSVQAHIIDQNSSINAAIESAAYDFQVPAPLLKVLCYMEGRLSNHLGSPSIDNGYGCMHLVKNKRYNTLDEAAKLLHVNANDLKTNMPLNIRGGAVILRQKAIQLHGSLPTALADWYAIVADYSNASTKGVSTMYADLVFYLLNKGFSARSDSGEVVTVAPQHVTPNKVMASVSTKTLPQGCINDGNTEYPGAINCIVNPTTSDCNLVKSGSPCTYTGAHRPGDYTINFIAIHDIEGTAQDALNVFQNPANGSSIHYIVDSDGTVYQVLHEQDIAYHVGNYWYNEHAIGIEHAGYDATGYQWYNATEYLASAKLVAYLLKKYHIPLDHDHVISHGTVPAPTPGTAPNHVDPGPYWLWGYYFELIHQQGIPLANLASTVRIMTIRPQTDMQPEGPNGTETPANFNFFKLYTGPSTRSGLIPNASNGTDITDETYNVEAYLSYAYLAQQTDTAGTGATMYKIYYGESDQVHNNPVSEFQNGRVAWLAIPTGAATGGQGTLLTLRLRNAASAKIYGRPTTSNSYVIGDTPNNSIYLSSFSLKEDGRTNTLWYEINYNHRQAWVPASEVA